jgi:cytochrome c553
MRPHLHTLGRTAALCATTFVAAASAGCFLSTYTEAPSAELGPRLATSSTAIERGASLFAFGDMHGLSTETLETNAIPWKLLMAALAMARADSTHEPLRPEMLRDILQPYGFITADSIANWPGPGASPHLTKPAGVITGELRRRVPAVQIEVGNLGCASCHGGTTYSADGMPTRQPWIGLPNTSLDLQAFAMSSYRSIERALANEARLLATIDTLYPGLSKGERNSMRRMVIPRARKRFAQLAATIQGPVPYDIGSPGLTNSAAAIKYQLGLLARDRRSDEHAFSSIPDLGSRILRSSLLYDGTYAPEGGPRFKPLSRDSVTPARMDSLSHVVALFGIGTMGVHLTRVESTHPQFAAIMQWVASYHPPRFPGPVDTALARDGRAVYMSRCASCHGQTSEGLTNVVLVRYPNRLVPQSVIGTDSIRWATITPDAVHALDNYSRYVSVANTGGYVPPPLSGVWATAPYFHNGSVPTVWHVLHPDARPTQFPVGGHKLDFDKLGIALEQGSDGVARYPGSYVPWSVPQIYDTRQNGRSNHGHERQVANLSEAEKRAVLEYLKLL